MVFLGSRYVLVSADALQVYGSIPPRVPALFTEARRAIFGVSSSRGTPAEPPCGGPMPAGDHEPQRRRLTAPLLIWGTFIIGIVSVFLVSPENEAVRRFLLSLGPLAPLAYLLAEIVQVVVIPVPGQPFEVAGGWILGLAGGSVVGSAGAIAGSLIAFHIARRFGRRWVEDHVGGGVQEKVARGLQDGARAEWIIFWLMMIPNFPRDPLCYIAGVSGMSTRSFVLIALLGRPVGLVPWVALGAEGAASGVAWQAAMIAVAGVVWLASRWVPGLSGGEAGDPEPEGEG
jgi:uncharacterized membrane protein YdjX (TVP38/TMEM64 family)